MRFENKIILARRERSLLGEDIRYVLYAVAERKTRFFVTVEFGGESLTVAVGTDVSEANEIFGALARGRVTPCSAADVVADLQYSRAF